MFALGLSQPNLQAQTEPRLIISSRFCRLEKVNGERSCHYTFVPCVDEGSPSSAEGKGVTTLEPPCPIFEHLGTGPPRAA
jgi:hypothetical protein